jgi:hypothetical protein
MLLVITSKEHTLIKDIVMSEKITLKSLFDEIESLRQVVNDLSKEIDNFKDKEQQTLKQNKKVVIIQDEPIIIKAKKNE